MRLTLKFSEHSPRPCLVCGASPRAEPTGPEGDRPCRRCGSVQRFADEPGGEVTTLCFGENVVTSESLLRATAWAQSRPNARLVLDFRNVTYLTSAALSRLLEIKQVLKANLTLRELRHDLREVFRVTHLGPYFDLGEL